MTNELHLISEILNNATATTVSSYSTWFFWNAVGWCLVGLAFIFLAVFFCKKAGFYTEKFGFDGLFNVYCIVGLLGFIGICFFFSNVADIFSPEGIAIHQLITDLKK